MFNFLENHWNIVSIAMLFSLDVNYMLYDRDVGEIAGRAQSRLRVRWWEIETAGGAVQVAGRLPQQCATPCDVLLGPPCRLPGGMRAPCLDLADDQGR
jgi:hypothetical protein